MTALRIIDSGLEVQDSKVHYLWSLINTPEGEVYRCVVLRELAYLPIETRDDPDVLGKQWAAVRGLYNAGIDYVYLAAGIFTPNYVGVTQFYGAGAEASSKTIAAADALRQYAAVEAVLANYPQIRLTAPSDERAR